MFDKDYVFLGRHATRVKALTQSYGNNIKLFNRNVDLYILAPLVGFLYGRTAEKDNTTKDDTKVFSEQVTKCSQELKFSYQMIMLLDKNYTPDIEERLNKAFRYYGVKKNNTENLSPDSDEEYFNSYVRGGVDVLYEKLIENVTDEQGYIDRLYDFIEDFDAKFNSKVEMKNILAKL